LIFGTLYPAYYSYKAVKSKDIKEYVSEMDDVLDHICTVHNSRDFHRHISLLVCIQSRRVLYNNEIK
ncbi:hypothetical protein lerEdw1_017592, partial [Lerista edwardsae]